MLKKSLFYFLVVHLVVCKEIILNASQENSVKDQCIAQMIKLKRCMRGLNKPEECALCVSESKIFADAQASGISKTALLDEVRHNAILAQQPAVIVDEIAAMALQEKHDQDIQDLLNKHEKDKNLLFLAMGGVGAAAVLFGFGIGKLMGSSN